MEGEEEGGAAAPQNRRNELPDYRKNSCAVV